MPSPLANRDRYRTIAARYRNLPALHGLRPYAVSLVHRSYSGTHTGEGTEVETVTELLEGGQNPKVRFLNDEELALNGLEKGTAEIGPITPDFSGGGTAIATLRQSTAESGDVVLVKLSGPSGDAYYRLHEVSDDRALHYTIRVKPVSAAE